MGKGGNDTVLQGSPEKSFFSAIRQKSDHSRSKSRTYKTENQPNRRQDPDESIAAQMSRISKSRSRSNAGRVNHLKELEEEVG